MRDLVPAATAGGALVAFAPGEALARVNRSKAWHVATIGDDELAGHLARALGDAIPAALVDCDAALEPAPALAVNAKLGPLLALTAGVGMADVDREEWLAAAMDALKGIPLDLLERGIKAARPVADHPSKIVPLIMGEAMPRWRDRLRDRGMVRRLSGLAQGAAAAAAGASDDADRIDPAEVEKVNAVMRRMGLASRYTADGAHYTLKPGEVDPTAPEPEPEAAEASA